MKIVLRLPTYEDLELRLVPDQDRASDHALKPKKKGQPHDPKRGSGGKGSGGQGPGQEGTGDSDLMKPS